MISCGLQKHVLHRIGNEIENVRMSILCWTKFSRMWRWVQQLVPPVDCTDISERQNRKFRMFSSCWLCFRVGDLSLYVHFPVMMSELKGAMLDCVDKRKIRRELLICLIVNCILQMLLTAWISEGYVSLLTNQVFEVLIWRIAQKQQ